MSHSDIDGADPAFPLYQSGTGMSLRDYFAAKLYPEKISEELAEAIMGEAAPRLHKYSDDTSIKHASAFYDEARARQAYRRADAMLKVRKP